MYIFLRKVSLKIFVVSVILIQLPVPFQLFVLDVQVFCIFLYERTKEEYIGVPIIENMPPLPFITYVYVSLRKGPKKIFGVPVIPGLPSLPLVIDPGSDGDDTTDSPRTPRKRTPSSGSGPSSPRLPWSLGHKDFLPKQVKDKNEEGVEQFR